MAAPRSLAPDHPDLLVRRIVGVTRERHLVRMSGISPEIELNGFNNDIDTLERAVKERVFYVKDRGRFVPPPAPLPGHFAATLSEVKQALVNELPVTTPLGHDKFVELYTGRKRKVYEKALESLDVYPLTKKDAEVDVFVKYEKTNFTKKEPVPRVISPRSPRYNIHLGSFLSKVEPMIFKSLSTLFEGHRTVFKGMDAHASGRALRAMWDEFADPVAIGLDASRFDQHVSREALEWEHSIYIKCFLPSFRKRLSRLLAWQVMNKCAGRTEDGYLTYVKEGGRMSGDMNTSLGNCILMCSMIKAFLLSKQIRGLLANNGDDCVVIVERKDLAKFEEGLDAWFLAMGFSMAVEDPVYTFEQIEFCQTSPVFVGPSGNDYLMVRNPRTATAKDVVCLHNYTTEREVRGWLHAVGTGGLAMCGGIPVMQEFYKALLRAGVSDTRITSGHSWGVRKLIGKLDRGERVITPESRASFWSAFAITPDEQVELEQYYRRLEFSPNPSLVRYFGEGSL